MTQIEIEIGPRALAAVALFSVALALAALLIH